MHGFKWVFGIQHTAHPKESPSNWWAWLILGMAIAAGVTYALTTMHPTVVQQAARIVPLPAPTVTVTARPTGPPPRVVDVTSATGPVCILPSGLPRGTLQIVKVP
jgi:hypothetical protein